MWGTNKKMHNKKGSLGKIMETSLVFPVISIMFLFVALLLWSSANDILFYQMQNITETMESQGIVKAGTSTLTQGFGDDFTNFNLNLDTLWFIAYLSFVISSFIVAYRSKTQNYFSFLGVLFYGIMGFLFLLTLFYTITEWFKINILQSIIPTAHILLPKFYYYLDNIGVFSAVHFVLCLLINMVDFDLKTIFQRKKVEQQALGQEDDEIL